MTLCPQAYQIGGFIDDGRSDPSVILGGHMFALWVTAGDGVTIWQWIKFFSLKQSFRLLLGQLCLTGFQPPILSFDLSALYLVT